MAAGGGKDRSERGQSRSTGIAFATFRAVREGSISIEKPYSGRLTGAPSQFGQEELQSIGGRTHTGRTRCDNDLRKSSEHLICLSAHWERVLLGAMASTAPNCSEEVRIEAHERL